MYFSARSASWAPLLFQQITRCHSVFSCFSPPWLVHCRLVARDNVATREPLLVLRTSGSAPKFPISMTLLRLRLTTDLQTLGGSGPRATTVYDPQVILSIKDTPLVLKFCRQHDRVFDGPAVVPGPSGHLPEAERFVQPPGAGVRLAHLEIHHADTSCGQGGEHLLHQGPPQAAAPMGPRHSEVEDLPLVRRVMGDHVAPDQAAHLRDEERNSRRHAFREIAARPGIGEYGALDRRDVVDVSRRGRTNPGRDGRGAPPIEPALRQGVRKQARRWPDRRAHDPRRRPPRGGGAPGRSARARPASALWARRECRPGPGERRTSRRTLDRAARRNTPLLGRSRGVVRHRPPRP